MSEHLDPSVLAMLQEVMEDEYPVLLDTFLSDSEDRLQALRQAHEVRDAEALRRAAHSFKGSCGNLGATLLAELCRQLEESARAGDLAPLPALLEQAEREFAIIRTLIESERQRHR
ncbi:HPt (histidine-containing phosphotransfer) domain-containing protein [Azotobacter beijerinckii]|uniref:HPt (Histidine-containing phosphotransfer) domain-containing protein n=2 Tax=Azotobacter beijerinckii TaxID=170623 RepID=A0A1I4AT49_9GAMM|nr:HPt (histidine-containing phosphotransfer) domain-containing protein [Azotobacter beijerinckii]SFK59655.1 HPt (histidine-containing phosphotransfer) domain-containing protein [Azotobacter beijerinckii]